MKINEITRPTLLLDTGKCIRNIERVHSSTRESCVIFRPHFKTHQSRFVGNLFKERGISRITVSSVEMAGYFSAGGWEDITIAFPFNPREYGEIVSIAAKSKLCLTIPGPESARVLAHRCETAVDVMIKIDTGYNRSGLHWDDKESIVETADILASNKKLNLTGLLTHTGDTYHADSPDEIASLFDRSVERMHKSKNSLGREDILISMGDTPSASVISKYSGVDEIRAGNFVFYDMMQVNLGVCNPDDIAVAVACPVVDIRKRSNSIVIYGGAVHFSKESIMMNGQKIYGRLVRITDRGWVEYDNEMYLTSVSQEHGIISDRGGKLSDLRIGDLIGILPVHSCLTANLLGRYLLSDGSYGDHMNGH